MWQNGDFVDVGEVIFSEDWTHAQVAEFCAYFVKYLGTKELNVLHKFL